jgi:hypothetical protein
MVVIRSEAPVPQTSTGAQVRALSTCGRELFDERV